MKHCVIKNVQREGIGNLEPTIRNYEKSWTSRELMLLLHSVLINIFILDFHFHFFSITVIRHHDHTVSEGESLWSLWQEAWQQVYMHGPEAVSESSHLDAQTWGKESKLGMAFTFNPYTSFPPWWHTFSSKATSSKPSQTVPPAVD